jgi:uncharacterized membrane protein
MIKTLYVPLMLLRRVWRKLGVRVAAFALLACIVAIAAPAVEPWMPGGLASRIGPDAVMPVLTILASSMLAVSTFSLNVMVSAHRAAAANATPRIHRLLLEDTTTQSVLAAFIGAFVFALTTIILFRSRFYGGETAVVVMGVTIVIVVMVVMAMLRWIEHLSQLGSMDDSMDIAYGRARQSLIARTRQPALGANPLDADTVMPVRTTPVPAPRSGYVQLADLARLHELAGTAASVYITRGPGQHVLRGQPIAQVGGTVPGDSIDKMARAFVIGNIRTHEQDPGFGLTTLSEIASRALSPGVNDPGTAIEAVTRMGTLLWDYGVNDHQPEKPVFDRVFLPVPRDTDLIEAAFAATARDGAGQIEVARSLRRILLALGDAPAPDLAQAAQDMAERALAHSEHALRLDSDRERLIRT